MVKDISGNICYILAINLLIERLYRLWERYRLGRERRLDINRIYTENGLGCEV
jgi:hypothetical protein